MTLLATELLRPASGQAQRWIGFVHGIMGSGANWRSLARKAISDAPQWGAVLFDLRGHGRSPDGEPPHTLAACADDVATTISHLAAEGVGLEALCGHSYGGKTVLAMDPRVLGGRQARLVLDSSPSARVGAMLEPDNTIAQVLARLRAMPVAWPSRQAFVDALLTGGLAVDLAQWLGLNVVAAAEGYQLRLRPDAIAAMLDSYFASDLWTNVEASSAPLTMVAATRSTSLTLADRARLRGSVRGLRYVELDSGHWVHIDAPHDVISLVRETMATI